MASVPKRIISTLLGASLAFGSAPLALAAEPAEGTGDAAEEAIVSDAVSERSELSENSWRYADGQLIVEEEAGGVASARNSTGAWSLSEHGYVNSLGGIIYGAVNKGIDVSEHQGWIDWEAVKADGIDFAIIRCGYGDNLTYQDDDWWEYNVSECERLGIPYGVYLYSYAQNDEMARSEAAHALRLLEGHHPTLPVFFDMEDNSTFVRYENGDIDYAASRENFGDMAYIFCDAMEQAGYWAGVYANLNWFNNYLTDPIFDRYMRWVAQYNYQCDWAGEKVLWQSTSSGTVNGVAGSVDINFDYFGFCYPNDVESYHWYVQDNTYFYVSKFGLMTGYSDGSGNWGPWDRITRGQLAVILWRQKGSPSVDAPDFSDVDYAEYYGDAIEWARSVGAINGDEGENTFRPDDSITREEFACVMANYASKVLGMSVATDELSLNSKGDGNSVSPWARASMAWCADIGIITGEPVDGAYYLNPQNDASRAEAASILAVFFRDVL